MICIPTSLGLGVTFPFHLLITEFDFIQTTEKRKFGTLSVGKREDIELVLVSEGLAVTHRHRDDDEKSPNYDKLCAAEVSLWY